MKSWAKSLGITLMLVVSTGAAAEISRDQLAVIGGTSPNPRTSEGYFTVYNRMDQDVICDLRVTGVISGRDSTGLVLTATQDSQPLQAMRLRSKAERQLRFSFESAVLALRRQWGDPNAKLTSVDRDFSYFKCEVEGESGRDAGGIGGAQRYMLVNQHSQKCLNLEVTRLGQDGFVDGAQIFQYECPTARSAWTNSYWYLRTANTGGSIVGKEYMIQSVYSGKCLDLYTNDGGYTDGGLVQQFDCTMGRTSDVNRNWKLEPAGGGLYFIKSSWSDKCLDVSVNDPVRDGFNNKARVQQWECGSRTYRANQMWRLVPI